MIKWMIIAFRNILRNKRRSVVTLAAVALGFCAVGLFRGYTDNTYQGLRQSAVRGEGLGHLTLYKAGWKENGKQNPDAFMFTPKEIRQIVMRVESRENVVLATPQIHVSGLVTNGRISTIFMAGGVVPKDDKTIKGDFADLRPVIGNPLSEDTPYGVEMAQDLAKYLDMKPGDEGVIMTTTLDGQMNALNILVAGIYDTGSDATNDKFLRLPFAYAQSLLDTHKADSIRVLLTDWTQTEHMKDQLFETLSADGIDCEIETWKTLSVFYLKVKGLFDMIFTFIFCIVLVIVVMSVVNTMGTAVLERTREIGTLRALGLKRRGVGLLFSLEGGMLGLFGSAVGAFLNLMVWALIRMAKPTYIPPGVSSPVPLIVNLVPEVMITLGIFLVFLSLGAAILPARRAAKQNIVDALGHI
jgi:putative ABC transport system permease protein